MTHPGSGRRFDAVLLDVGNTLLFVDDDAVSRELMSVGIDVSAGFLRETYLRVRRDADRGLCEGAASFVPRVRTWREPLVAALGLDDPETQGVVMDVLAALHARHRLFRLVPPTTRTGLEALRREGLRLAAVSNADGNVLALLEATGLARELDAVVDSGAVGFEKPDPRIFAFALAQLGVDAGRAVHAGDMLSRDVLGARAAGITGVLVDEDGRHFAGADVPRVAHVGELAALLQAL